jgi:hypothetical protein
MKLLADKYLKCTLYHDNIQIIQWNRYELHTENTTFLYKSDSVQMF